MRIIALLALVAFMTIVALSACESATPISGSPEDADGPSDCHETATIAEKAPSSKIKENRAQMSRNDIPLHN